MIIAIDGPSGTGKSSFAKALAERLNFYYFDTGAMYRCFAWHVSQKKIASLDEEAIADALKDFSFTIESVSNSQKRYFVNDVECTNEIREEKISKLSSEVAAFSTVRSALVKIQREYAKNNNGIFEGRDIGTVVFPKAQLKIFLTATPEVRAKRRFQQLQNKGHSASEISTELQLRDRRDSERKHSPLKKAKDAITLDTSNLTLEEVIEKGTELYNQVRKKKKIFRPMKKFYAFILSLAKAYFALFYTVKVKNIENFPLGPAILAANHCSYYDPPLVATSSPEEVHFLAKSSLFSVPFLGWLIKKLNSHPISRDAQDASTIKMICRVLQKGDKVLLFPEGSRGSGKDLQPFLPGLGFLAYKEKVPIIPIYIKGAQKVWGINKRFPKLKGKLTCTFGRPIHYTSFKHLEKKEAMALLVKETEKEIRRLHDAGA